MRTSLISLFNLLVLGARQVEKNTQSSVSREPIRHLMRGLRRSHPRSTAVQSANSKGKIDYEGQEAKSVRTGRTSVLSSTGRSCTSWR